MTKKIIIGLIVVLVAGAVYWFFVGPIHTRWERRLNKIWFKPEYNEYDAYRNLVLKFEVEKDLTIVVYLSDEFKKFDKLPQEFINQVNAFVRPITNRKDNFILVKYYDRLIYPE